MRYTGFNSKSNDTYVCRYSNARSVLVFKAYIYVNIYSEVLRLLSRFKNCQNIYISDARRICYALIDLTANGLKSALSARESEFLYEKMKSKCSRGRYEPSSVIEKYLSQEIQDDDETFERLQRNYAKKSKIFIDGDDVSGLVYIYRIIFHRFTKRRKVIAKISFSRK